MSVCKENVAKYIITDNYQFDEAVSVTNPTAHHKHQCIEYDKLPRLIPLATPPCG